MNAVWLLAAALFFYFIAYRFYGRFLARVFGEDPSRKTPAHEQYDGVDFVPAKNWLVLFGHHFSSICGAGPIVGPVLAVAYWGWAPSVAWVLIGSIFMGAVSDFSSLFVSMRSRGSSISEIAKTEISEKARVLFAVFIWISVVLVIAVFAIFAAKTFVAEPEAVLPSFGLIPTALVVGWMLYRRRMNTALVTLIGLAVLAVLLVGGAWFPVALESAGALSPEMLWITVLLIYCFAASVTPVQILLQPRDYLASFILFGAIALGICGTFITRPVMGENVFGGFWPAGWPEAGGLWPMLFVTIACGAISGFHSLVSSGTTCKQAASERHACRVGYGGMLTEGLVGVIVIVCVGAGLAQTELASALRSGGPIAAFSDGYGNISKPLLGAYGKHFAVLALNAFILTTLDTATRIARYLTAELFGIQNKYAATAVVVAAGGALALTGQWSRLWPAFGASNQLIAALALLVASCWLLQRGKNMWFTLIPSILMLVTTIGAFVYLVVTSLNRVAGGSPAPDFFIAAVATALVIVSVVIVLEAVQIFRKAGWARPNS